MDQYILGLSVQTITMSKVLRDWLAKLAETGNHVCCLYFFMLNIKTHITHIIVRGVLDRNFRNPLKN